MVICFYKYKLICDVKLDTKKITRTCAWQEVVCGDRQKTILNDVAQSSVSVRVQTFDSFKLHVTLVT